MKLWPPSGSRYDCWCGAVAVVPFRRPVGPSDREEPYAECPAQHRLKLETREVADGPDPSGPSLIVIIRAGTTLEEAKRQLIEAALVRAGWSVSAAAKELGLSAPGLYGWLRQRRARAQETPPSGA